MAFHHPGIHGQVRQRNYNNQAHIEGPLGEHLSNVVRISSSFTLSLILLLAHLNDKELQQDVREFTKYLPNVDYETVLRAARVAQNSLSYDQVARRNATQSNLLVTLDEEEMAGLVAEQDDLRRQFRHILPAVLTVGCAAFLQGHVQASINCSSLYAQFVFQVNDSDWQWQLGAMNAIPFFTAAIVGAPSALLFNYWMGRRGAITIAAFLIFASSLGSAWTTSWWQLLCVRIIGGVGKHRHQSSNSPGAQVLTNFSRLGMGIKAVSAPILASEISFAQWRGSSVLMWQLWYFILLSCSRSSIYLHN